MGKYHDLAGQRFGILKCLSDTGERNKQGNVMWLCLCDCGNKTAICSSSLVTGNTKSCGCVSINKLRERSTTHGLCESKLYKVWSSMKHRCLNKNDTYYFNYGGRGIKVCNEWLKFEPFCEWALSHGYKSGLTIERINNDGNYDPSNCKWIPKERQAENTRHCKLIMYNGETLNLTQWAKKLGLPYSLVQNRIRMGWSAEKTFNTKVTPANLRHCKK